MENLSIIPWGIFWNCPCFEQRVRKIFLNCPYTGIPVTIKNAQIGEHLVLQ